MGTGAKERWSPGMARARQHGTNRDRYVDVPAQVTTPSNGGFSRGSRVFHQKFGYGRVMRVEGDRLDIEFDKAGRKKVIASFIQSADQAS